MDNTIQYIGENLIPGKIAHGFIILSFLSILYTVYASYKQIKSGTIDDNRWQKLARWSFLTHGISVFSVIGILFYLMITARYEYGYVYDHVSDDLPMRYIFSAFWEGQEGSFLLWMFWHVVLGFFLIKKTKSLESPVLLFYSLIQLILATMILGVHVGFGEYTYKIGSNPTLLLRDIFDVPVFQKENYLELLEGTGLNPLLQNYWMTIHPPTLFLGFASASIPFSFAAGAMYTRDYKSWLTPVLKWSLFSAGVLGLGIFMGGIWAYEALTFGGYWAWDPVENMSLVPWIILVAGIHTNLIAKSTGRAIGSTLIYYCLTLVLVLYSTYLTRSGILGDTSAHAFTEMGLSPQLIFLVGFFAILSTWLYFTRLKEIPKQEKEESIYSREFWMFIGALVLLFSGIIISTSTSLPVFNKIVSLFNPSFEGSVINDPIPHYNKFQIWIAILISVLTAKTVYLRYKANGMSAQQTKSFALPQIAYFAIAAALTFIMSFWLDYFHWKYALLTVTCWYTVIANGAMLIKGLKQNPRIVGFVCGHAGFGLMILGVIASGLNEESITEDNFLLREIVLDEEERNSVNLIKGKPFFINNYWLTYESDTTYDKTRRFKIKFEREDSLGNKVETFYLYPNMLYNNKLTKMAAVNPSIKRYVDRDIFVHVTGLPGSQTDIEVAKENEDSLVYITYDMMIGDTLTLSENKKVVIESYSYQPNNEEYKDSQSDLGLSAVIRCIDQKMEVDEVIEPVLGLKENMLYQYPDQVNDLNIKIKLNEQSFDNFFTQENELVYESFTVPKGGSFDYKNTSYTVKTLDSNVEDRNYDKQEGDVVVRALIEYTLDNGDNRSLSPLYVIRGSKPYSIKDYDPVSGTHIRLSHINPANEEFVFQIAEDVRDAKSMIVDIAENVPRDDIIALEATIFPGINLFWSGTILMLSGFFISWWIRYKSKYA